MISKPHEATPMRISLIAASSALALAAVAAGPAVVQTSELADGCRLMDIAATPEDDTDDITLCEEQLFVRADGAPVSNLASATFSHEAPSTAPVGGLGVGGSATDIAAQGDPAHGLEVTGTFTGAVDSFDMDVYLLMPNGVTGRHGTTPQVEIDGFNFGGNLVDTTVTAGPNGTAIAHIRIDGMLELWPLLKFSYDADAEHTLRVNLSPYYIGDDGAYLYDGTDVPTNVVLNQS